MPKSDAEKLLSQLQQQDEQPEIEKPKSKRLPKKKRLPQQQLTQEEQRERTRIRQQQQRFARPKAQPEFEKMTVSGKIRLSKPKEEKPPRQKKQSKPKLTNKQKKQIRSAAAKKAAQTRKAKEAKLSDQQKQILHDVRAHNAAVNFAKKRGNIATPENNVVNPETGELVSLNIIDQMKAPPSETGLVNYSDEEFEEQLREREEEEISIGGYSQVSYIVLNQVRTTIRAGTTFEIDSRKTYPMQVRQRAGSLEYMLETAISEIGEEEVARRCEVAGEGAVEAANRAIFDSDSNNIEYYYQRLAQIIFSRPLSMEESSALQDSYEEMGFNPDSSELPF